MLLPILAAAVVAAAAPQAAPAEVSLLPPKTVSPLVVMPQANKPPPADITLSVNNDDTVPDGGQRVTVWPAAAVERDADGKVTLTCFVDVHGLAERCRVAWESPQGLGFGAAALALQPTLKLTPAKGSDGQPIGAEMNLAMVFRAPDTQIDINHAGDVGAGVSVKGNPMDLRHVVMMSHPVWVKAPSFDDLARAYPSRGDGQEGYAVVHCQVERIGVMKKCFVAKELPAGRGFAKAAMDLVYDFKVSPAVMQYAPHGDPIEIDIPIRFPARAAIADRTVTAPSWLAGVDPEAAPKLFPPEAAAKGVTSGRGIAKCVVAPDGSMTACAPESADPDGLGFSEAAVKLASTMRMNLWSSDAEPVEGGVVHVAIRLNLDPTTR
ncbi:MAG: hypothetical protein E7812_11630 [Phenylobacterium sp.]|nr:MAG: hypothetical protein E7812_11630 [Phenylobacterium sp.]